MARGRMWLPCAVLFACALAGLVACRHDKVPKTSSCVAENASKPQWVYQATPHNRIAVVFVHGIIGDAVGSWTNARCKTFFQFLHDTPDVGDKLDIYAFGFDSPMLAEGGMEIGEAAVKLDGFLQYAGIKDYDRIVFVAHSMGGLVTMRELSTHAEVSAKTPLVVFYATPHEGAQITTFARYLVDNKAIAQMLPVDGNSYLQGLDEDWLQVRKRVPHPTTVCAYEKKSIPGLPLIVPPASASRNCDDIPAAIEGTDHITIVKPDAIDDPAVVLLVNAIKRDVLPMMEASNWDTPDFRPEGDHWAYVLRDINGKNPAAIDNKGQVQQDYAIQLLDGNDMMMSPEAMPRYVAAGAIDEVRVAVVGDPKPEYRMKVRLGSLPERIVVARFADLQAAISQRMQRQEVAASAIGAYLGNSDNNAAFQAMGAGAQHDKLAQLATQAIAQAHPELSPSAQLLVAADTLVSLDQSGSAGAALRQMAVRFPDAARSKSAAGVAARVDVRNDKALDLSTATASQKASITTMADQLSAVPATRAEALLLRTRVDRAAVVSH